MCVCVYWEPVSKLKQRVRETAQQVQVLAAKAENLSSRPRTLGWKERNSSWKFLKVAVRPGKPWMNKQKKVSAYSIVYQAADTAKLRTLWIQSYSHFTYRQWCQRRLDKTFKAHRQSQPRTRGPYGQQLRWTERSWRVPSNDSGVTQQR